jgi:hypothetical protein
MKRRNMTGRKGKRIKRRKEEGKRKGMTVERANEKVYEGGR